MGEKTKNEALERAINRPFHYGYAVDVKTIYAYTKEEWGIGASSGGGDHNLIRSFYFSLFMMVLMVPASLACLGFGVLALFSPVPIMALVTMFFGVLFGLAVLQCWFNVHEEWRGRKARKLKGLPRPWWEASDDEAYKWFLRHPDQRIRMTLDFFPYSVVLQKQEAA